MKGEEQLYALAKEAAKGNDTAFIEICDILKLKLYKIAIGMLRNENLAFEAIDESVYKAYKSIKKLKQPQFVSTWFVRILLNVCHDMLQVKKKEVMIADMPNEYLQKASENTVKEYDDILIRELLHVLPENLKQIVSLKYFSDLTLTEISNILRIPIGTVKSKLNRALKRLRLEVNL